MMQIDPDMLTAEQIRAARALLGWSARELAERAGVHRTTVERIERSEQEIRTTVHTLGKVQQTLEDAGIEFISKGRKGRGVLLR
jgi:transcriptional regulator with XRE-family HTH domain